MDQRRFALVMLGRCDIVMMRDASFEQGRKLPFSGERAADLAVIETHGLPLGLIDRDFLRAVEHCQQGLLRLLGSPVENDELADIVQQPGGEHRIRIAAADELRQMARGERAVQAVLPEIGHGHQLVGQALEAAGYGHRQGEVADLRGAYDGDRFGHRVHA